MSLNQLVMTVTAYRRPEILPAASCYACISYCMSLEPPTGLKWSIPSPEASPAAHRTSATWALQLQGAWHLACAVHASAVEASLRRRPKSFTRGFGSGRSRRPVNTVGCWHVGGPGPRSLQGRAPTTSSASATRPQRSVTEAVDLQVPVWAGSARLPWGTRTGGRSKLVHTACEVGPGEYTAQHGFQPSGPSCKLGQRLQDRKVGSGCLTERWMAEDSRIDYPAPGHYPIKSTLDLQKAFKKGRARSF